MRSSGRPGSRRRSARTRRPGSPRLPGSARPLSSTCGTPTSADSSGPFRPATRRLDASILLGLKLGLLPWTDPRARQVVDAIETRLWVPGMGGLARYEGDEYYGHENPWIVCTLWLAEARLRLGDRARCRELIDWAVTHATPTRLLPEQVDRTTGEPKSATPLTWSHSTFVDVVHKYAESEVSGQVGEE